ncbi:MAG: LysR family transcriptional regulator [Burkholderiaceae bacterium]|nr:LysR family transcriptional regulator [Burkholderiaceae bacterium]
MPDLDLKTLRLLVAVCELRNIKQAAAQEHIEPSAISKRIALLEQRLGAPLLVRGRRGVMPTPAGAALLEHARSLLYTLERMQADVAAFAGGLRGQVRLVASASAIAESLLDDLAAFMRTPGHEAIQVDIEERFSSDLVRMVRDGGAALGVCWDQVDFDGLAQRPYRRDELVLAVPDGHALAGHARAGRRLRFEQTLQHDHVGLQPATAVHTLLYRAAAQAGGRVAYRVVVSNFDAALRVVAAGLGVSVIPRQVAQRAALPGVLTVALADRWAQRQFAICQRRNEDLQPAAARLAEFLAARAAGETPA